MPIGFLALLTGGGVSMGGAGAIDLLGLTSMRRDLESVQTEVVELQHENRAAELQRADLLRSASETEDLADQVAALSTRLVKLCAGLDIDCD